MAEYKLNRESFVQEDLCTANLLMDECSPVEIGLVHLFVHYYLRGLDIYEYHTFNHSENKAIKSLFEKGYLIEKQHE